jgi:hypothetical protein
MIFASTFYGDCAPGLSIDVGDGQRPEGNQVDSERELGTKRWEKFPVPAEKRRRHETEF